MSGITPPSRYAFGKHPIWHPGISSQALPGYCRVAVFDIRLLHLSNIALAPLGLETFNNYQSAIRKFYQYPLIELFIVIIPILVHAIAGIWLFKIRRKRPHKRPLTARLHIWAGGFFLLMIGGHVLATRGASFFYGVFPGFEGLNFSLIIFC